jgi:integrase
MTRKNLKLYEGHVANHILSETYGLGALRIGKVAKSKVGDFRDQLRNAGVSILTTRKVLGTLSRVLDFQAGKDRLTVNHARGVKVIGTRDEKTKRVSVPSKEAIRGLLEAADAVMRTRLMFAAFTGARAGEQWAARRGHVDFAARELTIEARVDAYGDEDVTKSEAGMRTIPLSGALVAELRAWKLRSEYSKDDDLIFPNADGGHVRHTNFLKRQWAPLFKAAGLRPFKWHHLRHFAASCWIEAKLQPKTVQTFIGHASLAMTMDLYGHRFKSDEHHSTMDDIAGKLIG